MSSLVPGEILRACWVADPVVVAVAVATARSTLLTPGVYYLTATTNMHFRQGDVAVNATTSSNYLAAGASVVVHVTGAANGYVACIRSSADGSAYLMKPEGA